MSTSGWFAVKLKIIITMYINISEYNVHKLQLLSSEQKCKSSFPVAADKAR